jgi:hypothetical protein
MFIGLKEQVEFFGGLDLNGGITSPDMFVARK